MRTSVLARGYQATGAFGAETPYVTIKLMCPLSIWVKDDEAFTNAMAAMHRAAEYAIREVSGGVPGGRVVLAVLNTNIFEGTAQLNGQFVWVGPAKVGALKDAEAADVIGNAMARRGTRQITLED